LDYPNAYLHQMAGSKNRQKTRLFEFPMTVDRRRAVIDRLAKYLVVSEGACQIEGVYPLLRAELGQFVAQETANGNVRYQADVGCHDDLVMSLAICLWVWVEEMGDNSPQPAISEAVVWRPTNRLDLRAIREAREAAIVAAEEEAAQRLESFTLNSEMLRGLHG
jgi:hypothetical protein